jgi:predicted transcriptional regulator
MATDIVIAYLGQRVVEPEQLPELLIAVRTALAADLGIASPDLDVASVAPAAPHLAPAPSASPSVTPRMTIEQSITPDHLISFEDGLPYKSLKRHLMARYNMTPEQYRAKWGLPADYPMVAPNYAAERSAVAKRSGLGRKSLGLAAGGEVSTAKVAAVASRRKSKA